jgi:FKBP-type peptidyl-prolyl cis-trans isomerase
MTKQNVVTLLLVLGVVGGLVLFNVYQDPAKIRRERIERARELMVEPENPERLLNRTIQTAIRTTEELRTAATAYMDRKALEDEMNRLDSGMLYKVISEGAGESPSPFSDVRVLYEGRLIDGTVFDSQMNAPATLNMEHVIPGWAEALQLMEEGDEWELVIPPHLGYGYAEDVGQIPRGSVLLFQVKLVAVTSLPAIRE